MLYHKMFSFKKQFQTIKLNSNLKDLIKNSTKDNTS